MSRQAWIGSVVAPLLAAGSFATLASAAERQRYNGEGDAFDFGVEAEENVALLYLSKKPTNAPLTGLQPVLIPDEGDVKLNFKETATPGVYMTLIANGKLPEGQLSVTVDGTEEAVDIYAAESAAGHDPHAGHDHSHGGGAKKVDLAKVLGGSPQILYGVAGVGLFLLGLIVGRTRRRSEVGATDASAKKASRDEQDDSVRRAGILALATLGAAMAGGSPARADDGHTHGEVGISAAGDTSEIQVTKKSQFLIDLRTQPAAKSAGKDTYKTFGHVVAKPQHDAVVRAVGTGFVKGTLKRQIGATVKKGEVLAEIHGLARAEVVSPIAGTLVEVKAVEGLRVDAGTELFRVVDTTVVWVDAQVFQKDLARLHGATVAKVDIDGAELSKTGRFTGAKTMVDEKTLTTKLYVEIDNADDRIHLGSLANVTVELGADRTESFVLPKSSVLNRGGERIVFVQTGPETFIAKPVSTSFGSFPNEIVVTGGLAEGDRVVVSGNYQLLVGAQ